MAGTLFLQLSHEARSWAIRGGQQFIWTNWPLRTNTRSLSRSYHQLWSFHLLTYYYSSSSWVIGTVSLYLLSTLLAPTPTFLKVHLGITFQPTGTDLATFLSLEWLLFYFWCAFIYFQGWTFLFHTFSKPDKPESSEKFKHSCNRVARLRRLAFLHYHRMSSTSYDPGTNTY